MTRQPGQAHTGPGRPGTSDRPRPGGYRIAGITVRLAPGAYLLGALMVLAGAVLLPAAAPGWPMAAYLAATAGLVAGVVGSVIAHELAHAIVARRHGSAIREITVGFFTGPWHGREDLATPRALWRTAAAGPAASLALAAAFSAAAFGAASLGAGRLTTLTFVVVAWVNALFAIVSALPGPGLDGGRVAHAWAWARSGDTTRAAVTAARAGQYTGALLIAGGVTLLALGYLDGIWAGIAGLVMAGAARAQARQALAVTAMAGLHVRDVLPAGGPVVAVPGWQTVQFLIAELSDGRLGGTGGLPAGTGHAAAGAGFAPAAWAFPVQDFGGRPAGLLTLSQLASVPAERRASLRVLDVATPLFDVVTTGPGEPMSELVSRLAIRPSTPAAVHTAGHALVLGEDGTAIGVLTPADFARARQLGALYADRPVA